MKTPRLLPALLLLLSLFALSTRDLCAQQQNDDTRDDYASRTRALDDADSQAEREAERLVSLPPERIILLLQQEPGLFLEVKKMLVRKAYAQGRVLDPQELADDAIFRRIREDEDTRALITQQIVDRGYVRAKPTREQVAKEMEERQRMAKARTEREPSGYEEENGEPEDNPGRQDRYAPPSSNPLNPPSFLPNLPPQESPSPSAPQNLENDQTRQLMQASATSPASGQDSGLPFDAVMGDQTQLSPEQIQQLISTYGKGQTGSGAAGKGNLAAFGGGRGSLNPAPPESQEEAYYGSTQLDTYSRSPQLPQQAKLETNPLVNSERQMRRPVRRAPEQPRLVHRANPYADVPSLYDLYAQYSQRPTELKRFGMDIFENGTGNFDQLPMDLPAGPEYVLGPGDGLNIDLWGSVSQRLHRVVDREGRLSLPEIGVIQVAGHSLGDVQHMVQTALRSQFRELEADVSLDRLRAIRVYVVGDVERPGAYDISSLSTSLNALYQAGGPTPHGSMRIVKHFRGNQLVATVDLYDLLLHGVEAGMERLESGDMWTLSAWKRIRSVRCCASICPKAITTPKSPTRSSNSIFRMATKSKFRRFCPSRRR